MRKRVFHKIRVKARYDNFIFASKIILTIILLYNLLSKVITLPDQNLFLNNICYLVNGFVLCGVK